jgi:hypothetical protein
LKTISRSYSKLTKPQAGRPTRKIQMVQVHRRPGTIRTRTLLLHANRNRRIIMDRAHRTILDLGCRRRRRRLHRRPSNPQTIPTTTTSRGGPTRRLSRLQPQNPRQLRPERLLRKIPHATATSRLRRLISLDRSAKPRRSSSLRLNNDPQPLFGGNANKHRRGTRTPFRHGEEHAPNERVF